jgi:hypothetical protein
VAPAFSGDLGTTVTYVIGIGMVLGGLAIYKLMAAQTGAGAGEHVAGFVVGGGLAALGMVVLVGKALIKT